MEGPRGLRTEEFESLRELVGTVFRPSMFEEYPQLFNADNFDNLRVCLDGGRCVSHVGMTERRASLFGCAIQVCCIGAVATYPEYRGQGLASACFDDAVEKAYQDGIDLMIVSGDRGLYRSRGCLRVGDNVAFTLTPESLPVIASAEPRAVTIAPMTDAELPLVMDYYRQEPVRFLRPPEDYRYAVQSGFVMNRAADFLVVRERGDFCGYLIVRQPYEGGKGSLNEFAGDRHALLAALPQVFDHYRLAELHWEVSRHDTLFHSLCDAAGLREEPTSGHGTSKLINFPQLMERLRPRWEELLGCREAARLIFRQQGEQYVFGLGEETWITDRDTATRMLFGTVAGMEMPTSEMSSALAEALQTILPLPTLWYGINYV